MKSSHAKKIRSEQVFFMVMVFVNELTDKEPVFMSENQILPEKVLQDCKIAYRLREETGNQASS